MKHGKNHIWKMTEKIWWKRRVCALCLLALTVLRQGDVLAKETPEELRNLYARSAVLMDGGSGRVLFGKEEKKILPMASTTKIMTCMVALEMGKLDSVVTASANAASQPKVHLGVYEGETFYLKDLLYSLMLESHNDSAVMIAEHIGGSVEEFAALMNRKAQELGCTKTHYVTPNGLDGADAGGAHATTAEELARVMAYCVNGSPSSAAFLEITQARSHVFTDLAGERSFSCTNHNTFLDMMDGMISGKTGFTNDAGYCYVGALKRDGRLFVVALLACGWPYNRGYKWSDTRALMEYGLAHYEKRTMDYALDLQPVAVKDGLARSGNPWEQAEVKVQLSCTGELAGNYLLSEEETIERRLSIRKTLTAPVKCGSEVGRVQYFLDGTLLEAYPIVALESVPKREFGDWMGWVIENYCL